MVRHITRRPLLAGLAGFGLASPALAQSSTAPRPITIIVPFAPGGSTDIVSRLLAERMTSFPGQPVQVETLPLIHILRSRRLYALSTRVFLLLSTNKYKTTRQSRSSHP